MNENIRKTIMHKEILEQPESLRHCLEINREPIKKIAEKLKGQKIYSVILSARGSSSNACVYFRYLCEKYLGLPCSFSAPSVSTVYGGKLDYRHSLVIGVSQSGMGLDVMQIIRDANSEGAITVGVTNNPASLLGQEAQNVLLLGCGEEKSVAATKTFLTQMACLGQLVAIVSGDGDLEKALERTPELVNDVIANEEKIEQMAYQYRDINDCYFLARGYNYAASLESALKLQETTYARGKAYSIAEFYHGPFAVVNPEQDVVLLHGEGKMDEDAKKMLGRLVETGCQPLLVTNDPEFANYAKRIAIPSCPETVASFPLVATIQLFVNAVAAYKGNNPDQPRGLKKVTVTK